MNTWLYYLLLIELSYVSYLDIRIQKIHNFWSLIHLILFFVLLYFYPQQYSLSFGSLIYSMAFLVVGFVLFALKIMGGGDSKFLASFFLLVPASFQLEMLNHLLLSTVLIGGFLLLTNMAKNFEKIVSHLKIGYIKGIKQFFGTKFSFAPVILLAWIWIGWKLGQF